MGLQHAIAPATRRLFQSMMGGGYQNFWQAAGLLLAAGPAGRRRLLDQLFGSDQVSRRVAHQAADYAGVSTETMQQMLTAPRGHPWPEACRNGCGPGAGDAMPCILEAPMRKDGGQTRQSFGGLWGGLDDRQTGARKEGPPIRSRR